MTTATPSLSIRDADHGKVLVRCHAGCDQDARHRGAAVRTACGRRTVARRFSRRAAPRALSNASRIKTTPSAARPRSPSGSPRTPRSGTPVETYLASRGLHLPPPTALRFHAGLKHPSGGFWPAMVALVTRGADGTPLAIHRTFLARDGGGKAPVDPQKMMLGPCRGGAVRLAEPGDVLMVGEGIETCLAAMQATGHAAWAALSTSGLRVARSAARRARRDRAGRWRRSRRGGGAGLRPALEARGPARAHRPPAAGNGLQRHAHGPRASFTEGAR